MKKKMHPVIPDDILKQFSNLLFTNQELGIIHNPYDQELCEMRSIEQGDLDGLKQSLAENYSGKIGRLAKNDLRNAQNLAIVNTTLSCRAAIRGGVMPEIAFSLSDALIQKIEECEDSSRVNQLMTALKYQYAYMVSEIRDSRKGKAFRKGNYHVERCKDYIFAHLHGKLTLSQIAEALSLNASYLSDLFRRCEGISLTAFIREQKINLAKNLLIYSDYSYSEIAAYLGYASQSHLGMQFKNIVGLTLRQYKELYGVKYYMHDKKEK